MAANKIRVNTQSLTKTRQELEDRLKQIKTATENITEAMTAMNAMWTGEAHDAFQQNVTADLTTLEGVCDGLTDIINYEKTAVKEYDKCEEQVSEIIAQIQI